MRGIVHSFEAFIKSIDSGLMSPVAYDDNLFMVIMKLKAVHVFEKMSVINCICS